MATTPQTCSTLELEGHLDQASGVQLTGLLAESPCSQSLCPLLPSRAPLLFQKNAPFHLPPLG